MAYVLEGAGVDKRWRGCIGNLGLTRLNAFAMLAPNEQQMADVLRQDFGLDPKTGIKNSPTRGTLGRVGPLQETGLSAVGASSGSVSCRTAAPRP